jgi:hypothetical protein
MTVQSQKNFLNKLHEELSRTSDEYRSEVGNKKTHVFKVTKRAIDRAIKDYLQNYSAFTKKQAEEAVRTLSPHTFEAIQNIKNVILNSASKDDSIKLVKATRFTLVSTFDASGGKDRFSSIYRRYRDETTKLLKTLNTQLEKAQIAEEQGSVFNLEHFKFEGILESQVSDAIDVALQHETSIGLGDVEKFLKSKGLLLVMRRKTSTETMQVFVGSAVENRKEGAISKDRKKRLLEALERALVHLDKGSPLASLPGSDSFVDVRRKKVIKVVTDPLKKIKGVKVTTEDTKIKKSNREVKVLKKGKTSTKATPKLKKSFTATRNTSAASAPLQLLGVLNQQLPRVVQGNMGVPALENRSGRFAGSVRVTDISTTARGFPSVGYTYQKNPYQTFEPGFAQGSVERDPRKLIDRSIREIAAQFVIGRLYTRRL